MSTSSWINKFVGAIDIVMIIFSFLKFCIICSPIIRMCHFTFFYVLHDPWKVGLCRQLQNRSCTWMRIHSFISREILPKPHSFCRTLMVFLYQIRLGKKKKKKDFHKFWCFFHLSIFQLATNFSLKISWSFGVVVASRNEKMLLNILTLIQ